MRKMIVNLGNNKFEDNNNSTCQLIRLQNLLLISTVDTHEKGLSNVDRKSDMRKVRISSVNSSSKLFYFSIGAMYTKLNHAKRMSHVEFIYS